jgi:regulation of enolase protein 1 (concanavalin A-like superfamily)
MNVAVTETALDTIPKPLRWTGFPSGWYATGDCLEIGAGPDTDMFIDPLGTGVPVLTAPRLLATLDGDLQLSARVQADLQATFDAATLLVWVDETTWAKLCFELSPQGKRTIVSVVTRGRSDDANAFEVDGSQVWLRVARVGDAFAFHASTDGKFWHLVRYFSLYPVIRVSYGFEAQSPTGDGCTVTFRDVTYRPDRLAELRDGS